MTRTDHPLGVAERPHDPDAQLVTRAQAGDLDAFDALVRHHSTMALTVAHRYVGNRADAEDIAQEAFLAAWRSLGDFRGQAAFASWLRTIVIHRASNAVRGRAPFAQLHDTVADWHAGPADTLIARAQSQAITTAIATLIPVQRAAVTSHYLASQSYTQVARATRTTPTAVAAHLYRARKVLAGTLRAWR